MPLADRKGRESSGAEFLKRMGINEAQLFSKVDDKTTRGVTEADLSIINRSVSRKT